MSNRLLCVACFWNGDEADLIDDQPRAGFWARLWDRLTSHGRVRCPRCYSTDLARVSHE